MIVQPSEARSTGILPPADSRCQARVISVVSGNLWALAST